MARPRKNYVGKKFGYLTILSFDRTEEKRQYWVCKCDCGSIKSINIHDISKEIGGTTSCGCRRNIRNPDTALKQYYKKYKRGAVARDISWDISLELFREITSQPCCYCGALPSNRQVYARDNYELEYICNGIDRVDNIRGYESDNCVPCCSMCNYMKLNYTADDFIQQCKRIAEYNS